MSCFLSITNPLRTFETGNWSGQSVDRSKQRFFSSKHEDHRIRIFLEALYTATIFDNHRTDFDH